MTTTNPLPDGEKIKAMMATLETARIDLKQLEAFLKTLKRHRDGDLSLALTHLLSKRGKQ
jgi:hypothetical protein